MPFYEYACPVHKTFDRFYKSFIEAEQYLEEAPCPQCKRASSRIVSAPLGFGLYGEGFYKGSATRRYSTKLVSKKDGNKNAIG